MTSTDLLLRPSCDGCGSTTELYGSNCKHMTLCLTCGKDMAQARGKCYDCGVVITRLIREYPVLSSPVTEKNYFIGRFVTGLPVFSKKRNADNRWSLHKDGLQGRQLSDAQREKFKNKPWMLEDETGQFQYQGHLEGSQSATYYLLMMQGKEFVAIPAGSWYNFNKVAQYKQLTLEEAEEKMKNRRKTADGYGRWMMKAANNGAAAFGEKEVISDKENVGPAAVRGRKKTAGDDEEANASDKGEEDEEEEAARKNRLGLNKRPADEEEEEGPKADELDMDDDDIEKGDDWEHEEIFTDDDEAVAIDPEEREDLAPEIPAPPEIKEDEEDGDEENGESGLSKSGKELKKLLGKASGLNDSDAEDDDDDEDVDDDTRLSPVLAPKQKDVVKEEPVDNSPAKPMPSGSNKGTPPASKSSKGKRKLNGEDVKSSNGGPPKKVKSENDLKHNVKEESVSQTKSSVTPKDTPTSSRTESTSSTSPSGPVTEDEIRAVLLKNGPVTTQDLVSKFKSRLRGQEDKNAFAEILRRISKIQRTHSSSGDKRGSYVVLRDK